MAPSRRRQGTVAQFEEQKGYGTVRTGDGGEIFFHCTAIADGGRTIEEGATVTFDVVAGRRGQWEAVDIQPG
jgi:cold shock CspA family protein